MHDHHRVALPRLPRRLVPNAAPQVDDEVAVMKHTARAADLVSSCKVCGKRLAYGLERRTDVPLDIRDV